MPTLPDLSHLPAWAQVLVYGTLGVCLAIAFLVARVGVQQGQRAAPPSAAGAQVAAVIVDPTALNAATAEVAGLSVAVTEATVAGRQHTKATIQLAEEVKDLREAIGRLGDEVIRAAAKVK